MSFLRPTNGNATAGNAVGTGFVLGPDDGDAYW
jgi:hypothetical protein